jgi:hypothetical protein
MKYGGRVLNIFHIFPLNHGSCRSSLYPILYPSRADANCTPKSQVQLPLMTSAITGQT